MLARRRTTILPAMTLPDALDTTRIPRVASDIGGAQLLYHPIAPHPQIISRSDATLACCPSPCVDVLIAVQGYTCQCPAGTASDGWLRAWPAHGPVVSPEQGRCCMSLTPLVRCTRMVLDSAAWPSAGTTLAHHEVPTGLA
jgi:hypothetical protein